MPAKCRMCPFNTAQFISDSARHRLPSSLNVVWRTPRIPRFVPMTEEEFEEVTKLIAQLLLSY